MPDVHAKIFKTQEMYGIYLGLWKDHLHSNNWWCKVLIKDKIYLFTIDQIEKAVTK